MTAELPVPAVAGVIGWPVAHSKSPLIHRFWLEKLGIDGDYGRFPVAPGQLGPALRALPALGLRGVNVTIPHKVAVLAYLDSVDDRAAAMGAVNTVWVGADGSINGSNTDIDGILEPLRDCPLAGRGAIIAGSGGAARAALQALRHRTIGHVKMIARDAAKAQALLDAAGLAGTVIDFAAPLVAGDDVALFFNATSLGMAGQPPLPVDVARLPPATTVFDAVYAPLETPLLAAAAACGLPVIDGLQMLVGQAATAFERFFGVVAPRQHDAELKGVLTR
jgi:shikimate dehydrogenase